MSAPERIWHTIDRKGRINGCPDAHVMPCADVQEAYAEYVRADPCDPQDERVRALEAENARLREAGQAVVDEYPVSAGTSPGLCSDECGYGSIYRLRAALRAPEQGNP